MPEKPGWTPDDVLRMAANPIYTGIPPYPSIVDDDLWVKAAVKIIDEVGLERFLRVMLKTLRDSMDAAQEMQ